MNCYLAKIVYQIICGEGNHTPQFDEQLRLITASSYTTAFEKATQVGHHDEDCFFNKNQKIVQWKFIDVSELYSIADYADGTEIYSCIKEISDAGLYIQQVQQKAKQLQEADAYILMPVS